MFFYRAVHDEQHGQKATYLEFESAENHAAKCQVLEIYDLKKTWFLDPETGPVDPSFVGCLS